MTLDIFTTIIISLFLVVIILILFKRAKLSPILGYLFVGIILGPDTFGIIKDPKNILTLADFGVMFLMFTIGLEFSFLQLRRMKYQVFVFGFGQVILTVLIVFLGGYQLGLSVNHAFIIALICAMSSTAIVLKHLMDHSLVKTRLGRDVTAILLFQDLSVIPAFILIYSLASPSNSNLQLFALFMGKSLMAIFGILAIGHLLIRPLFREVAETYSLEIFTLTALLITLSASWITYNAGLTLSLGGFIAGMLLSETDYRHQLEAVIRPFRDLLVGVFFVSVGLLFNFKQLPFFWLDISLLLFALMVVKMVIVAFVVALKRDFKEALIAGLVLAQGSEFGFALLTHALSLKLLPYLFGQAVLGALLISMLLSTFIIKYNDQIADKILAFFGRKEKYAESIPFPSNISVGGHVIICGFGRVGQSIGRILKQEKIDYVGIDINQRLVEKTKLSDQSVIYGDATLYEILVIAKLTSAAGVVITFEQLSAVSHVLQQIRAKDKKIPIFLRTIDDTNFTLLKKMGATEVIPTSLEASLMITSHLLAALQVPAQKIWLRVNEIRKDRYNLLHNIISSQENTIFETKDFQKRFITLSDEAFAVGRTLNDLSLHKKGVLIAAINRAGKEKFHLDLDDALRPGDTLRLYGLQMDLDEAEEYVLDGDF